MPSLVYPCYAVVPLPSPLLSVRPLTSHEIRTIPIFPILSLTLNELQKKILEVLERFLFNADLFKAKDPMEIFCNYYNQADQSLQSLLQIRYEECSPSLASADLAVFLARSRCRGKQRRPCFELVRGNDGKKFERSPTRGSFVFFAREVLKSNVVNASCC